MKNDKEKELIEKIHDRDKKILFSKILDKYYRYEKTGRGEYSDFLNKEEISLLTSLLNALKRPYNLYIENEECERFILYFGKYENFVVFYRFSNHALKHSDVLGSLFGCGFSYSMIGDIFITEEYVYMTCLSRYSILLTASLTKVGREKVTLEKIDSLPKVLRKFQELKISVASTRLDLVIAHLTHMSRSQTELYMKEKRVFVNDRKENKTYLLKEQDILSIEKIGKFIIQKIDTNNSKFRITVQKYC